jgi:DNA polymerase-3 subunit gamma/tau
MYAPSSADRYKVYIVDEAHMLTREAWNALLKILEEPPPRVVFVFATTEPQKIAQMAAPVLSRLQRFDLKRIGAADIRHRLRVVLDLEGIAADDDALALIARAADGSMRDALSLADQVLALGDVERLTVERVGDALGLVSEDECLAVLELVAERRAGDIFPAVARLADAGVDFGAFLAAYSDLLRAQLALLLGTDTPALSDRTRTALAAHRQTWSPADVLRMLSAVTELEPRFRRSGQQQMLLETLLVRCALQDRSVALEDVLRSLGGQGPGAPRSTVSARAVSPPAATDPAPPAGPPTGPATGPRSGTAAVSADQRDRDGSRRAPSDRLVPGPEATAIDAQALRARWPEIVAAVRRDRQAPVLSAALEQAMPEPGPAAGVVTLRLAERNAIVARALQSGQQDIVAALRGVWPQIERIVVTEPGEEGAAPLRRMSVEAVRADQVAALRRNDAVLGAAIDALDLELIE